MQCVYYLVPSPSSRDVVPGDLDTVITCEWRSDLEEVILEVPQDGSKSCVDSDRSTWRRLLVEMEDEDVIDVSINNHDMKRPGAVGDGAAESVSAYPSCVWQETVFFVEGGSICSLCFRR